MYRASPFGLIVVRFPLDFFVGITPEYRPGMRLQMWSGLDAAFRTAKARGSERISRDASAFQ
jgi:hypothetical protein